MSDTLEKLKRANSLYPNLLDYEFSQINCPECSTIEDDQYYCTLCDNYGSFDLIEIVRHIIKQDR